MPSTVTLSPSHAGTNTRTGYGIADSSIVRDASLSITARLVWVLLDSHQGARELLRIKRVTLLAELDCGGRTLDRALAELIEAGLLEITRTGRSSIYRLVNPSRGRAKAQQWRNRVALSGASDVSDLAHLQSIRSLGITPEHKQLPAPESRGESRGESRRDIADPLYVESVLAALPDRLRPEATPKVAAAVAAAAARGWTPGALVEATRQAIKNPRAGAGLTVTVLEQLSQQPPREFGGEHYLELQRTFAGYDAAKEAESIADYAAGAARARAVLEAVRGA